MRPGVGLLHLRGTTASQTPAGPESTGPPPAGQRTPPCARSKVLPSMRWAAALHQHLQADGPKNSLTLDPPPQAETRCHHPWNVLVHTANSPEGKESHDTQGHQQLDQQNGIDLGVRGGFRSAWGALLEAREAQAPSKAQGDPNFLATRSTLQTRILGLPPSFLGGIGMNPGQGERTAKMLQSPHPWDLERRDHVFSRSRGQWALQLPSRCGITRMGRGMASGQETGPAASREDPPTQLPSLGELGEAVTFLMKTLRTFWSSQLKVVKSSWSPVGKPLS